jgi:hypothetical protein
MRRLFIATFIALLSCITLSAQSLGKFELGAGYSPLSCVIVDDAAMQIWGVAAFAEYRFCISKHFEAGAKFDYKFGMMTWDRTTNSYGLIGVADFKILPGKKVNPFIGIGLGGGIGFHNDTSDGKYYPEAFACGYPRMGLEIAKHLRLSLEMDFSYYKGQFPGRRYSPICFNVGWVF